MGLRFNIALAAGILAIGPVQAVLADPLADGQMAAEHGDYGLAMRLWRPLADRGNVAAQYDLGVMYADHRGVPQSYARAMEWYRRAADGRYAKAQHALGDMYYLAVGVPQDYTRAAFWYRRSADQGFALGQGSLAVMYENGFGVSQDNVLA